MTGLVPWLVVALPLVAAGALSFVRGAAAGWGALVATALTLGCALALPWHTMAGDLLRVDPLAAHLAILAATAAVLAAWRGRARATGMRSAAALAVLGGIELAALSNNIMLGWVGLEVAVLGLLLGGRPRGATQWRAMATLLPALALVLLGALVLYHAGLPVLGPNAAALRWDRLAGTAPTLPAELLSLGFILMLAGLACCAGLAPLHAWQRVAGQRLEDRGNALATALLPALGATALGMILRTREIATAHHDALDPGPALLTLGLASLVWTALALWRQANVAPASALFHAGLATTAFGLGTGTADAAGLLLLSVGVLMAPMVHGQGRSAALLLAALAMLPPFATFGAGLTLLGEAVDAAPWLALPLAGLMVAGAAGFLRAAMHAWHTPGARQADQAPAVALLILAVLAGLLPQAARWFERLGEALR